MLLLTECYFCLMLTKLFAEILIYLSVLCRMSIEMVACITIEAISILEKMHSKGYFFFVCVFDELLIMYICILIVISG